MNHTSGNDKTGNYNIKVNADGTVSPIDPTIPSRYTNLPTNLPSEPPINTIEEILKKVLMVWKEDYPKSDGDNGLLMDEYFERLEQSKVEATQAISTLITQARIEARAEARKQFFEEQHRVYEIGYVGGNYKILERTQNRSQRNRKFRVECIWCKSVMSRYSNKFKAKHKFCNNWRNENNRIKELSE